MDAAARRMSRRLPAPGPPALAVLILLLAVGCGEDRDEDESSAGNAVPAGVEPVALVTDGYIDDASCTECHAEIARTFHDVGMGRSFARWRPEVQVEGLENARVVHAPSMRHYEMVERDGSLFLRRWQIASDGRPINEIEVRADWAIGSGNHARSYAHQSAAGDLYELPLSWYSQEGKWAMSPGFDSANNPDLLRRVGRDCLACHTAYPAVTKGSDVYGKPHLFPPSIPEGIGCQRCHGPGREHVDVSSRPGATPEQVRASIVNPVRLDPARRDDVCLQCHLQPSTAFTTLTRAFGTGEFQFRPGDALHEHLVVIDFGDETERAGRFEINHHSYRMFQSPCSLESDGALTCLSCHDPHRKVPVMERAAFYRSKCLTCHEPDGCTVDASTSPSHVALDDCVACHMPQRRPHDVVHAVMTDHRIGIHPDSSDYLAARKEQAPLQNVEAHLYWSERMGSDPRAFLYTLMAQMIRSGPRGSLDTFKKAVEQVEPRDAEPWTRLGDALSAENRLDEALRAYQRALTIDAENVMALSGAGSTLANQGKLAEATGLFGRALNADPEASVNLLNMGLARAATGSIDEGIQLITRAVEVDPFFVNAHLQLGSLHMQVGDFHGAVRSFRQAMAIEPRTAAYSAWGDCLRLTGDWKEAVRVWEHGLVMTPQDRSLLLQLAFARLVSPELLVRNPQAGLEAALSAVDAEPDNPQAVIALALAHLVNGDAQSAIEGAQQAVDMGGDRSHATLLTGAAMARLGSRESARDILRQFDGADVGPDFIAQGLLELLRESTR